MDRRNLFVVKKPEISKFTGYLTVNEEQHSNLFFWYFPAEGTEHLYEEDDDYEYNEDVDDRSSHQPVKNTAPRNVSSSKSDDSRPVVLVN